MALGKTVGKWADMRSVTGDRRTGHKANVAMPKFCMQAQLEARGVNITELKLTKFIKVFGYVVL